jgi:SOS-response transcriptional repressor LexA
MMADPDADDTPCSLRAPYALQVLGEEMAPEFPDGCIVIIEPTDRCRDGAYVFAEVEGVRWFRQFRTDAAGPARLVALHPRYPDIVLDGCHWSILGVIIQRNIRRQIKHYREG